VVKYTVGAVAAQSSFSTQPSTTATSGTAFTTQPIVTLGDYTGAHVVGDPVQLSIATHPVAGTGTLTCTANPVTSVALGVASFAGCSISGPVGAYTLSATDTNDGLVVATSSTITLSPGTPTKLAFIQNPTAAVAGAAISPAVTVAVEDAAGNVETGDHTTTVGLSITTNPGGGTLTGGFALTVVAGVATFPGLSINKSGTGYILTASSTPTYTGATSSAFNITPGTANRLAFIQGPTTTAAGAAMTPAVTVAVEDTNGNVETSDSATKVTLTIGTNPGGGTLNGGSQVTVVAGVATFSGLSINKAGTGYTLTASSTPAYSAATSSTFNITPGAPTQLAFVQGPTNTAAGSSITPAVTVAVEDANGNVETSDSVTKVTLGFGTNPGGGTLTGGSAATVVAGIATFSGLSINKSGTGYTLSASSTPVYTTPTSSAFNITPGAPTKLAFIQNPTNTAAGSAIAPPVTVAVEDANGNIETGDGGTTVSLAIGTNPGGGTLSGGSAVTVIAGIATFSGLSINIAGSGYTLTASSNPAHGSATSSTFNITPGAANSLVFVQGPSTTVAASTITPAVTVAVEDSSGNVETGDSATKVSLAFGVNAGGGTLTGGAAVTVVAGIATFSGLSINKAGTGYTLTATSAPSYTAATSSAFNITPGPPTQLAFVQGPTTTQAGSSINPAVTVAVEDANGNIETGDNGTSIALTFGTNPSGASLTGGSSAPVVAGVATFAGLSINKVGTGYTLTALSTPSYTVATSAAFNVTPGTPAHLAFVQGPTTTAAGSAITPSVTVAVEDTNGNVETGDSLTQVALSIGTNPGGGTLTGGSVVTVTAGVATFSGLSIDKAGAGYTLTATSSPSYAPATSAAFNITPGTPTHLVILQGPSTTNAGSAITPAVTVAVEDANGNVETGDHTTTVSLAIGINPSGGTLTGGSAIAVVAGVATFPGLSINLIGAGYTLTASSTPTYATATSLAFNITPGAADHLALIQGPTSAVAGSAVTPAVTVAVEDANGNVETGDNGTTIGLTIGTNAGGGTLTGGSALQVVAGVATFPGLSIDKAGTGYTLTASSTPIYTPATSSPFNITPGAPSQLAFVQGPTNAPAGSAIGPAVTVAVEDANGNVETGDHTTTVSLAIGTNPGGGTLTGGSAVPVASGIATFPGLSIDKVGTGYTLVASSTPIYTPATSSAFNITPGIPTQLVFVQGPTNAGAGSAISPAVTVAVEDANGNVETGDHSTTVGLAIGTNPGGGTLTGGSTVPVVAGVATFSGLSIDMIGVGYTLTAASTPSYAQATSSAFNITTGIASHLAFVQGPTSTVAGAAMTPAVTVAVEDASGNVETGDNGTMIGLTIGTNPGGGALTGGTAVADVAGVATFSGLTINKAGVGYTLSASSTPSYPPASSSTFNITPAAPTQLAFVQGPTTTVAGTAMTPAVTVAVEDANGNVATGDTGTTIGLTIGTNPGGGTLTGGSAVADVAGVATFSGLSINKVGTGYTLTASSTPIYSPATSSTFNVTLGTPSQLAFVQGATNAQAGASIAPAVTVAVEDAGGNVETGDTGTTIGLTIGTNAGGGALTGGTAVPVVAGIATFSGLSINKVGTGYTLTASSTPIYSPATSSAFDISPGAPAQLAFVQGPTNTLPTATMSPAVTVAVEDANGNIETGDHTTTVSLAIGTNPGSGTLTGGAAVAVVAGVATFSGLSINNAGTGYTLTASSTPNYSPATSSPFNIAAGAATQLVFIQGPTTTVAGSAITPAVTVAVEDASGNVETSDNGTTIGLMIGTNAGGGTLTGGTAVHVVAGIATFSGLSIDKAGTGYTLTASSTPMYTPATSSPFDITPGAATQLAFVQGPSNTVADATMTPAVTVAVEDANGNVETGDHGTTILLMIGTNPSSGTLSGGSSLPVSGGIATFPGLSIDHPGTGYTLTASSTPIYSPVTSSAFNITPGTATQLAFIQGPTNSVAGASMTPTVTVAVEDANGNVETGDTGTTIGLMIGTNPGGGTLTGGATVTVSAGEASFPGLSINKTGVGYTLTASSTPSYPPLTSSAFNITPGAPSQLAFVQGPTNTVAGSNMTPAVTVAVEDANGNVETGDSSTKISMAIGTNPGGGALGGGSSTTVSAGVATFASLSIDTIGVGYTLTASSVPSYTAATSSALTISGGQLALSCVPPPLAPATPCQSINLPAITLDGVEQTTQATGNAFYVTDNRGMANEGWSVSAYLMPTPGNPNVTCADVAAFCNSSVGTSAANPQGQIPASHFSVGNITCTAVSGNSNPAPQPGTGGAFPSGSGAVSLCSAPAGQSAGTFKLGATYSLGIPEGIYAGQYQATVEYVAF